MTSLFWESGEKRYNRNRYGLRFPALSWGPDPAWDSLRVGEGVEYGGLSPGVGTGGSGKISGTGRREKDEMTLHFFTVEGHHLLSKP